VERGREEERGPTHRSVSRDDRRGAVSSVSSEIKRDETDSGIGGEDVVSGSDLFGSDGR